MTTLTHTMVGVAIGATLWRFDPNISSTVGLGEICLFSAVFSNLPDINMLYRNLLNHHKDITHYPIVYIFLMLIFLFLESTLGVNLFYLKYILCLCGLHLFMDLFGVRAGLYMFMPFSTREYSFTKLIKDQDLNIKGIIHYSLKNGVLVSEIIVVSFSTILFSIFA